MRICAGCKRADEWEGDGPNCDGCRIGADIAAVLGLMQFDYPNAADWNCRENGTVEILDAKDKRIAVITQDQLDGYYNHLD